MIYAIGDLHLGLAMGKPMDKFGAEWAAHHLRIAQNWRETVRESDTVLLAGDTSWAMDMEGFAPDLQFIRELPGQKVIIPGNHDYWWGSTNKLNALDEHIFFLKCGFTQAEGVHICGARGWLCPNDALFTAHDEKIYRREAARLKLSLDGAMKDGAAQIIVMMHFPPMNDKREPSLFTELFAAYPVQLVVYGHLHGAGGFANRIERGETFLLTDVFGKKKKPGGMEYRLVSCDYTQFRVVPVL